MAVNHTTSRGVADGHCRDLASQRERILGLLAIRVFILVDQGVEYSSELEAALWPFGIGFNHYRDEVVEAPARRVAGAGLGHFSAKERAATKLAKSFTETTHASEKLTVTLGFSQHLAETAHVPAEIATAFGGGFDRGGKEWVTPEKQAEYFMQGVIRDLVRAVNDINGRASSGRADGFLDAVSVEPALDRAATDSASPGPSAAGGTLAPAVQPPTNPKRRKPRRLSIETLAAVAAAGVVIPNERHLADLTVYRLKRLVLAQLQKRPCEEIDGLNLDSKTVDEALGVMLNYFRGSHRNP
jgi:hypothetical protein